MTQKLTVAGALVELKLLDKRIRKSIGTSLATYQRGKELPNGYKTVEEVEEAVRSNHQSALDLIKRRALLKSAIVISNANTYVTVGTEKMLVAEAIERKTSIEYDKMLLHQYKTQLAGALHNVDIINKDVEKRAQQTVDTFLQGDNASEKVAEAENLRQSVMNAQGAKVIDPLDLKKLIAELEESIDMFEANVDLALSTSNAITELELS